MSHRRLNLDTLSTEELFAAGAEGRFTKEMYRIPRLVTSPPRQATSSLLPLPSEPSEEEISANFDSFTRLSEYMFSEDELQALTHNAAVSTSQEPLSSENIQELRFKMANRIGQQRKYPFYQSFEARALSFSSTSGPVFPSLGMEADIPVPNADDMNDLEMSILMVGVEHQAAVELAYEKAPPTTRALAYAHAEKDFRAPEYKADPLVPDLQSLLSRYAEGRPTSELVTSKNGVKCNGRTQYVAALLEMLCTELPRLRSMDGHLELDRWVRNSADRQLRSMSISEEALPILTAMTSIFAELFPPLLHSFLETAAKSRRHRVGFRLQPQDFALDFDVVSWCNIPFVFEAQHSVRSRPLPQEIKPDRPKGKTADEDPEGQQQERNGAKPNKAAKKPPIELVPQPVIDKESEAPDLKRKRGKGGRPRKETGVDSTPIDESIEPPETVSALVPQSPSLRREPNSNTATSLILRIPARAPPGPTSGSVAPVAANVSAIPNARRRPAPKTPPLQTRSAKRKAAELAD